MREQTLVTVLQAFCEANFLNDMLLYSRQIQATVLENEVRRTIKGVLSDIYFAHLSTLFLENFLQRELTVLAKVELCDHQVRLKRQSENEVRALLAEEWLISVLKTEMKPVIKGEISRVVQENVEARITKEIFNEALVGAQIEADTEIILDTAVARGVREAAEEAVAEAVVDALKIGEFVEEQVDLLVMTDHFAKEILDRQTEITTTEAFAEVSI